MDHELPSIRPLKGCLIVLAAVVLCVGSVSATFDARCMSTFNTNLPRHPEAQMVQEFYPFLGTKFLYVYVPYDPVTVQTWYSQRTHVAKRNDRLNGTYTAWYGRWRSTRAADGTGTDVILWVDCP
ncbi:MAG TPA: hypothetical protein PLQ56_11115 [Aggregatilineales bacterium]|nr:hypothetical protein [Aggregatilineales bacterium]